MNWIFGNDVDRYVEHRLQQIKKERVKKPKKSNDKTCKKKY
jgi:hypothetical protein